MSYILQRKHKRWVAAIILLVVWAGPMFGAAAAEGEDAAPPTYKATIHAAEGDVEKKFDMTKPEDKAQLVEHLQNGEIHHMAMEEPVNIMAIAADLGVWTLVVFILLLLILRKAAWGPMLEGLQKREENIKSAAEEAKRARGEAEELRQKHKAEMDAHSVEVREIMEEARRDAQHTTNEMIAKAQSEIQTERGRLRREIDTARDQALKEISDRAADLASLVSAKAIRRSLSVDDHRRLVDEALGELRTAGAARNAETNGTGS